MPTLVESNGFSRQAYSGVVETLQTIHYKAALQLTPNRIDAKASRSLTHHPDCWYQIMPIKGKAKAPLEKLVREEVAGDALGQRKNGLTSVSYTI